MTKTTTVPHLLEQLSVDLCSQGEKFDTATAYGVPVILTVRYEPVSAKHDTAHFVIQKIASHAGVNLFGSGAWLEIGIFSDITHLVPKRQVAAIEENLLAQMINPT